MSIYATLKIALNNIKMAKFRKQIVRLRRVVSAPLFILSGALIVLGGMPAVYAQSSIQQQIDNLDQQNSQAQSVLNGLQLQASSYQNAISQLQSQINDIQSGIAANQAEQTQINQEITSDESQITQQKTLLGKDIEAMYVDGQLTTVEMLATSGNLSNFVNAETYKSAVQDKLQSILTQIASLEDKLEGQKTQLQQTLQTEQAQQTTLQSDQSQENQLLSMNQSQQDTYNQQIQANNTQIAALRAQQAAANASIASYVKLPPSGGSGGACDIGEGNGGYPMELCNAAQDSITDPYGFPNRECTSFAYWYFVTQEGQTGFQVSGNAGWWWETSNYPVITWSSGDVKVGALGVEPSSSLSAPVPSLHGGYFGHVMVVKALPGQDYDGAVVPAGDVLVASMNEDEAGHFMYNYWPVNYLMFINPR